jgi:hypothetical protein
MKKLFLILSFIFCFYSVYGQADDPFHIDGIDEKYYGVYLPVEYLDSLNETKNHFLSLMLNSSQKYHDILIVGDRIIYSNLKYHDSYAIKANEALSYKFITGNGNTCIIDNNNYKYRRISIFYDAAYDVLGNYIAKIIFNDLNKNETIELFGNFSF